MTLLTLSEPVSVSLTKSAGGRTHVFEPNKSYVLANAQYSKFQHSPELKPFAERTSQLDSRIRNFVARENEGGTVLFYNGCGGYGDQIMAWPVAKYLNDIGYSVFILTEPGNELCWWRFPWVKSILTLPIDYEVFKLFDFHANFEFLSNFDEHPDQLHPVDLMFEKIGIDSTKIPIEKKVVAPELSTTEINRTADYEGKTIGLYQLSASNPNRSLTPDASAFILQNLAHAYPDWTWLALYDQFVPTSYPQAASDLKIDNVRASHLPYFRDIFSIVRRASLVVAPDSLLVHVAGSFGIPCVGMWGTVSPDTRVRYYKRHVAVYKQSVCKHSPCHFSSDGFPSICPPLKGKRNCCEVLSAVTADDVLSAANLSLSNA